MPECQPKRHARQPEVAVVAGCVKRKQHIQQHAQVGRQHNIGFGGNGLHEKIGQEGIDEGAEKSR